MHTHAAPPPKDVGFPRQDQDQPSPQGPAQDEHAAPGHPNVSLGCGSESHPALFLSNPTLLPHSPPAATARQEVLIINSLCIQRA